MTRLDDGRMKLRWTLSMYRRLLEIDGQPASSATSEGLQALARAFPDIRTACESLGAFRKHWRERESDELSRLYAEHDTAWLAAHFGCSSMQILRRASKLGLRKAPGYMQDLLQRLGEDLRTSGAATRFSPGHVPANKGIRGWTAGGRSRETRFKKGNRPHTWKPIGTEILDKDGYLRRKVSENGRQLDRWPFVHVLVWEEHHGRKVPSGHAVTFRDGDKANLDPENLELLSRAELMRRNTIHNLPEPVKMALFAKARLVRVIREMEDEHA